MSTVTASYDAAHATAPSEWTPRPNVGNHEWHVGGVEDLDQSLE